MSLSEQDKVIIQSAKDDFVNGNYQQTIRKMDNLRVTVGESYELLLLQARAYAKLGNQEVAINIINEIANEEVQPGDVTFIVTTYLNDSQFISARKLVSQLRQPHRNEILDQIVMAEHSYRRNHRHDLVKLQRKLFYIGSHSADLQARIVKEALHLPLTEYLEGVTAVLIDKAGWQVIKTQFLFELISLQIDDQVKFLWLDDQIHTMIPAKIDLNQSMKPLTDSENIIMGEYENNDPITAQLLITQIYQLGNYLFPYAFKVINNPKAWVTIVSRYVLEQHVIGDGVADEGMIRWLEAILKQEQRIKYM
ncbi:hypothetical protein [Lentilactobacillus kosonis]|uniref:TPR repeat protein n=1 Tax=Lentilactobacillus kosonis TaxID=2810561 RepID=A0A401FP18_9LACO|nr:hypothetical protein [Lentilactobacillus kosonis]GAY74129.1 hypothetical protein NBRC111893_2275 [Lentilactobacillus kosonis]